MESIGAKLAAARGARGLSIEQTARDTHIARRFIEALESENFEEFPAETYLLGFMRSYSTYLGLDSEELITLYRNLQIQEQPPPIDELLDRRPTGQRVLPFLIGLLVVAVVGGVAALFLTGVISFPERPPRAVSTPDEPVQVLDRAFLEDRFAVGARLAIPVDGVQSIIEFVSVGERVIIGSAAGRVQLAEGEERVLDITGEGSGDVRVVIRTLYPDAAPPAVVARIDRVIAPSGPVPESTPDGPVETATSEPATRTAEPTRTRSATEITSVSSLRQYFFEADIRGFTMVRWEVDDQPREERYLQNGERIRASVRDGARLWVSNAGNVRLRVDGVPVVLGDLGEVVAARLRWRPVDDRFLLELLPLY